jgi:TonB family protein
MRRWTAIALLTSCLFGTIAAQAQEKDQENARPIVSRTNPAYPVLARRLNLQGVVRLRVTVTPEGSAQSSEVLGGNPVLAAAAQDAVSHWKWVPGPRETKEIVELKFAPR